MDNNQNKQFAVYDSDTPVTLKQGQGHQTWYEFLDPKQGHNKAKFFKLEQYPEKADDNFFGQIKKIRSYYLP